jgi:1-acyl-sn-glycerol-3-phosphate acyltransferase
MAFVTVTLPLLVLYFLGGAFGSVPRISVRRLWCCFCLRLLGVEVRFVGSPMRACATLFVANHVSYLDIVLLGSRTDATFIAKAEVRSWPLFGTIGMAARTFFIRRRWRDALIQRNALAARMRDGESFILFAEGTSTNGLDVLPLKTSLLSVAEPWIIDRPIAIQPVTLAYRTLKCGTSIGAANCGRYAWFGRAELLPHLWSMLHEDGCVVDVVFGDPVMSWSVKSRKQLGSATWQTLRAELQRAGSGAAGNEAGIAASKSRAAA